MNESFFRALREAIGDAHVLTSADAISCVDWRGRYRGTAACILRPGHVDEVAAVVKICVEHGVAIVPQGGNTGLCGGATPQGGEAVLVLTRLNRIRHIDTANNSICVEAGCTLQAVQEAAAAADRLFPLSLAAEGSATIGGNLSTNAGGVHVLRYGTARELALGLEVVLPDGRIWHGLRTLRKDATGYDLKHLFIGAEGTLGLITAATLKLFPRPIKFATAWVTVRDPAAAVALLGHVQAKVGAGVTAFELIGRPALELVLRHIPHTRDPLPGHVGWSVLVELSASAGDPLESLAGILAQAQSDALLLDAALATSQSQAADFWRLRESISEAQKIEGFSIKHDIAVPVSCIPNFIQQADAALNQTFPGLRLICFGHVGDGNLHYNQSMPVSDKNAELLTRTSDVNRIVHDIVSRMGGAISAEHGIGQLKRDELRHYKSEVELDLMRTLKQAFDPHNLMNPGKLV